MVIAHVKGQHFRLHHIDEHARESWLWSLDARAKLIGVLALVVAAALLTQRELIMASLAFALVLAFASEIPVSHLARAYLAALPFVILASLSVGIYAGLDTGLNMLMRTSACVLPLLVLASGTETFDLFGGLRRLKVPAVITTLLMLTYKFILLLTEEYSRMMVARKARGFRSGRSLLDRRTLRVLSYTAGMVLVRASARGDRVFEGMKSKGFEKDFRAWSRDRMGSRDLVFASSMATLSALLLLLQSEVLSWPYWT